MLTTRHVAVIITKVILLLTTISGTVLGSISTTHQDNYVVTNTVNFDESSSSKVWSNDDDHNHHHVDTKIVGTTTTTTDACYNVIKYISKHYGSATSTFDKLASISIHRNGDPDPCSDVIIPLSIESLAQTVSRLFPSVCDIDIDNAAAIDADDDYVLLDRYQLDTVLTDYIAKSFIEQRGRDECNSTSVDPNDDGVLSYGFYGHCDMGEEKTVIHKDHNDLIRIPETNTLPCRWYTREGLIVSSLEQLVQLLSINGTTTSSSSSCLDGECPAQYNNDKIVFNLYAVPAGRVFMFGPKYIGEEFVLNHVHDSNNNVISLKVISLQPRVFDIYNFFSLQESESLLQKSIQETSPTYRFHRSTTGTAGASVFSRRTSENAWDTNGETASIIKRRCFDLLGFESFDDAYADGLQVLRYNQTTAYVPHMDYLDDRTGKEAYNYDTAGRGGNRFSTILLYFNDLPDGAGGETVFSKVWPPDLPHDQRIETKDMIKKLRSSGEIDMLKPGSWEEEMVANCRTKLAVKPHATRAVLFYSQYPNGEQDPWSYHGGCPVTFNGTKYAANLWTWSGIRPEFPGAPLKRGHTVDEIQPTGNKQLRATFSNKRKDSDYDNAQLYYNEDTLFGNLGPNDNPISVNTYKGHVWNVKDKNTNKILATFVVDGSAEQYFSV